MSHIRSSVKVRWVREKLQSNIPEGWDDTFHSSFSLIARNFLILGTMKYLVSRKLDVKNILLWIEDYKFV